MIIVNHDFAGNYTVVSLDEIKHGVEIFYFPGASTRGGKDGLLVEVMREGKNNWLGIFAFGDRRGFCGIFDMPSKDKICVVSRGSGYIVSAEEPHMWEEVKCVPNRLSFDGFKITNQDDNFIEGEYFDMRSNKNEIFKVDLRDGAIQNSAGPISTSL